jgi:poly(hydroxyalkanoate) granule-associated protein
LISTFKEIKMGKKLKELAGDVNENQLASTVKESAQQIWLAGLGAFAKAQEEGGKVFDALVKEGETIQAKTRKMTDEKIADVAGKATGTWDRLEQVFEDRVARALGSLGVPSKQDIDKLSKRVVDLSAAVQALTEGQPAAKPASPQEHGQVGHAGGGERCASGYRRRQARCPQACGTESSSSQAGGAGNPRRRAEYASQEWCRVIRSPDCGARFLNDFWLRKLRAEFSAAQQA